MGEAARKSTADYFAKLWGTDMPTAVRIRDSLSKKTAVDSKQLTELYGQYQKDMDYYAILKKYRTPESFGKWLYGKVDMPSSQRYVPESNETWQSFIKSVKWGE